MSQLRPLLSPLLVGRDELLALADRRLAEAAYGHGQLLLLAGEAGIGKTRLLQAILSKGAAAGFRVAKADLAPQDRQVPLASIRDLARTMRAIPAFGSLGDDLLALDHRDRGDARDSLGLRRVLVHEIADRLIGALDAPTLLAFEDLQWADELSLEVIGELARLAGDRPALLVAAYRLDELPPGSSHREWRARLLSQRLAEEARLAPLTYDETALVTSLILATGLPAPREVATAIFERTDGIPLYIEELLGALEEDARTDGRAIRRALVPSTIEDAILARVALLSEEARAVARAGAVIGRCFVPDVLAGIMDRRVADIEPALEELVSSAFLYAFSRVDQGYYDFRHQLLRDALYGAVPAGELRRLHARAAEFGAQLEGSSEVHASVHFERAGLRAQAYRTALAGARAASSVSSRQEAFELYARAAANVPEGISHLELAELFDGYAEAASAVDNVAVVIEAASAARRAYREAGQPVGAASMLIWQVNVARRDARPIGERLALLDTLAAEIAVLPPGTDRDALAIDLLLMRAIVELDLLRLDDAATTLAEGGALARSVADIERLADVEYWQGALTVLAGRPRDGLATTLRVARHARVAGFESPGVTAYRNAAVLAARVMDYPVAVEGLAEGLRYADEIEQSYCRHVMAATSALVAWADGRWDEAVSIAEQELVEPSSRRGGLGARDALGYVALGRGDVEQARTHLEASLAGGRESGEAALVLPALWGLAETALVSGDPLAAADRCEEAMSLARGSGERPLLVPFLVTGVRALQAAHRPEAAQRWIGDCLEHLRGWEDLAGAATDHATGLMRLAAGSTVSARSNLESAVRGWGGLGRSWETCWARLDLAACLIRGNRHLDAVPHLVEVRAAAERLVCPPLRLRADELSRVAMRRGITDEPWHPLTIREYEVARLIATGLTNAGIAADLGVAPKTVSAHVEHILAKLGLARRAEIAAWVSTLAEGSRVAGARPAADTIRVATRP